ncbi:hypothetical protein BU16DRAFT_602084 [Lophium mytilinum]|uniref:Uncharacterized protein n=1 Tax=Lophium mytilinum TaxID=390894 RepID=A0A6A6R6X3_9PEZI|nr:hypothetical protein BU16DRAFT_602084 [Lophium mytilinum]
MARADRPCVQRECEAGLTAGRRGLLRTVAVSRPLTSFVRCHDVVAGTPPSHDVPPTATCPRPPSRCSITLRLSVVGGAARVFQKQRFVRSGPSTSPLDRTSHIANASTRLAACQQPAPLATGLTDRAWRASAGASRQPPSATPSALRAALYPRASLCVPDAISHGPQLRARANSLVLSAPGSWMNATAAGCAQGATRPTAQGPFRTASAGACRLPAPAAVLGWMRMRGGCVEGADAAGLPSTAPTCPLDPAQTVPSLATAAC